MEIFNKKSISKIMEEKDKAPEEVIQLYDILGSMGEEIMELKKEIINLKGENKIG